MIPEIYRGFGGSEVRYLSRGLRVREIFADIPGGVIEPSEQGTGWIGYHDTSGARVYPRISNPFSVSANLVNAGGALIATVPAGGSVVLTYGTPNAAANPRPGAYGIYALWVRQGGALVSPVVPASRILTLGIAASGAATAGAYRAVRPGQVVLAFVRVERRGERIFGVPAEGDAISSLDWYVAGMPWFSGAEASARAGQWVRRESWATAGRAVRFIEGAGTTRAVAVDNTGAVLTPSTFGAAEFLGDDWALVGGGTTEPAAVDITDLVFSGASARPFVVIGDRSTDPGGGTPGEGGQWVEKIITFIPSFVVNPVIRTSDPWRNRIIVAVNFAPAGDIPPNRGSFSASIGGTGYANFDVSNYERAEVYPHRVEYYNLRSGQWVEEGFGESGSLLINGGVITGQVHGLWRHDGPYNGRSQTFRLRYWSPTPGTTPGTGTGSFPSSGEGFPYVRDGQVVRLVPARDLQTEAQWRP